MIDFVTNRQVLFGADTILELPKILAKKNINKVLLAVFSTTAACVQAAMSALEESGIEFVVYDKIIKEPDLDVIDNGVVLCKQEKCGAVVAIGGGSVIDACKAIAMLATNKGVTEDYQLHGKQVEQESLLFVAIPTTAGTGAEATKVSVVYNAQKGWKKALYDNSMIAPVTILDPTTTIGLPAAVTASTGMDAITHAIESYTSVNANSISKMYSLYALKLLANNIVTACKEPTNLEARGNMLLGSYFAGCAISVGTCLAHIVGQPVGAIYNIPHGDACSIFLTYTMELNIEYALAQYVDIAKTMGIDSHGKSDKEMAHAAIQHLRDICNEIGAPTKLTRFIKAEEFDMQATLDNIQGSMGHIKNNPRPVSRELFEETIKMAL